MIVVCEEEVTERKLIPTTVVDAATFTAPRNIKRSKPIQLEYTPEEP